MSDIKRYFTSRWGEQGNIVELDYSQLEIYILAYLSFDTQLIKDLRDGVDLHTQSAANWLGKRKEEVTDKERKTAKSITFQLQYGAGAASIARENGISLAMAKKFIAAYYARYHGVELWQRQMKIAVDENRVPSKRRTKGGYPAGESVLSSITGRRYTYVERDAPDFMREKGTFTSFSPTEIKNYPVQGLATGDIVQLALGLVHRALTIGEHDKQEHVKLVNTVHDSIVLDIHDDCMYTIKYIKKIMEEDVESVLDVRFGIHLPLSLKVGVSVGKNWLEQEEK